MKTKKYKLIETYPSSPELGTIGWIEGHSVVFKDTCGKESRISSSGSGYKKLVKTFEHTKNWEPILEKTNISIDIETLSTATTAAIVQIGAVKFTDSGDIISKFERNISFESLEEYGFTMDYNTVLWWLSQEKEAINKVFSKELKRVSIKKALVDLDNWIDSYKDVEDVTIWSHASFDPPILKQAFKTTKTALNVHYRSFKDLRTLKMLSKNTENIKREGTSHVALDDAIFQMKCIVSYLKK